MKPAPKATTAKRKVIRATSSISTSPPSVIRSPFGQKFLENRESALKKDLSAVTTKRDELLLKRVEQCQQSQEERENTSMVSTLSLTGRQLAETEYRLSRIIVAQSKIRDGTYGVCPGCSATVKPDSCACNGLISPATLMRGAHYNMCDACNLCKITSPKNGANHCLGNSLTYAPIK